MHPYRRGPAPVAANVQRLTANGQRAAGPHIVFQADAMLSESMCAPPQLLHASVIHLDSV